MKRFFRFSLKILDWLGLTNSFSRIYFKIYGKMRHLTVHYDADKITVTDPNKRRIIISNTNLPYLIDILKHFDYNFGIVVPNREKEYLEVDYSKKRLHKLSTSGREFYFSTFPECDDVTDIYLKKSGIKLGDTVIDFGAFCGASVYSFSKAVGDNGRVIAVEADTVNCQVLKENISLHNLKNVTVVNKAIWSSTTVLKFQSEGNLGSAVSGAISRKGVCVNVDAISFQDLLNDYNIDEVNFVKMDIEGSEVEVVKGMEQYIKEKHFPMIIETHAGKNGEMTSVPLQTIFSRLGKTTEFIEQQGSDRLLMFVS